MLGLNPLQLTYLLLCIISTLAAWWIAKRGQLHTHRFVAYFLTAVTSLDVIGVLVQHAIIKDAPYARGPMLVELARRADIVAYVGWAIGLAVLATSVFDGSNAGKWVRWGVVGVWSMLTVTIIWTFPSPDSSNTIIEAHKALVDHVFTIGHVLSVGVGMVFAMRFYALRKWPLPPHLVTTILLVGGLADCAGQYAQAKPSSDYSLSSVVGIIVHSFVSIAQAYTIGRITGEKRGQ